MCINLINSSNVEQTIKVSLSNADLYPNGSLSCGSVQSNFSDYVTGISSEIKVPANGSVKAEGNMVFPASAIGNIYGCVAIEKVATAKGAAGVV
ncbi:MAG: hypothetical protein H6765_10050 [Candidatus Peribacteria bacterium]|nr:MAG: hypothetical protein H6765_10050 [Candidatus Peribacteria bacterium]